MTDTAITRMFPATIEASPLVVDYIGEMAAEAGVQHKRIMHLQLAVEEAVVNICHYAYATPPGEVEVQIERLPGKFIVRLVDNGVPFDPLAAEEPDVTLALTERQVGGLGIFLVRRVMDEVHYQRIENQNTLTLVIYMDK